MGQLKDMTFKEVEAYYDDNTENGCNSCKCNDGVYCPLSTNHCCLLDLTGTSRERNGKDDNKTVGEFLQELLEREVKKDV